MRQERPPFGPWDLKLIDGGLVDIEFAAQFLQIALASNGAPLQPNTSAALAALLDAGAAPAASLRALETSWALQQNLSQVLKVALADDADPGTEPVRFQSILAKVSGARTFKALCKTLAESQAAAHQAYERVVATTN